MRVEWSYLALFAIVVAALAFFAYAVVRSQGTSVNVTLGALRTGHADFDLAGVRFNQTAYVPSPFPDGSDQASYIVTFPDGTQEGIMIWFGGYCYAGGPVTTYSVHRNPGARFSWACGDDYVRVTVV